MVTGTFLLQSEELPPKNYSAYLINLLNVTKNFFRFDFSKYKRSISNIYYSNSPLVVSLEAWQYGFNNYKKQEISLIPNNGKVYLRNQKQIDFLIHSFKDNIRTINFKRDNFSLTLDCVLKKDLNLQVQLKNLYNPKNGIKIKFDYLSSELEDTVFKIYYDITREYYI